MAAGGDELEEATDPAASAAGTDATSLVTTRANGGRDSEGLNDGPTFHTDERCPRIDHDRTFWVNLWTGEVAPARCGTTICPLCGPVVAWQKSVILSHGGASGPPQRYAVLSQAPREWDTLRQKMRDYRRLLGRRGYPWEHAWTVEVNPQGTGHHVNVLQKGAYVPQAVLQDVWGAIVHVQAIKRPRGVASYSLKDAQRVTGYSLKDAGTASTIQDHLAVNGGRLCHVSRGYLGGMTQADTWKAARRQPTGDDRGWRLVTK